MAITQAPFGADYLKILQPSDSWLLNTIDKVTLYEKIPKQLNKKIYN